MGLIKFLNPRNYRQMINILRISNNLDKHMKKRCAYCDWDMGTGDEVPIVEFVNHLAENHLDKIDAGDVEVYRKMIKDLTN